MGQFENIILHYQATNIINTTVSFGVQRKDLKKKKYSFTLKNVEQKEFWARKSVHVLWHGVLTKFLSLKSCLSFSNFLLPGSSHLPNWILPRCHWRGSIPASQFLPGKKVLAMIFQLNLIFFTRWESPIFSSWWRCGQQSSRNSLQAKCVCRTFRRLRV